MDITEYINEKQILQETLICFMECCQKDEEEFFEKLKNIIDLQKVIEDENEFRAFLYLILNISQNYHRTTNFFLKIDKILSTYAKEIKKYLTNDDIYIFFKNCKRIILFLIENKIITLNNLIITNILKNEYLKYYFYLEIKDLIDEEKCINIENELLSKDSQIFNNFKDKCQIGENDSYICDLIRKDSVEEFVKHINKANIPLSIKIPKSIFETNAFLLSKEPTLIEYTAFYGSMKIFNYLLRNNIPVDSSVWVYAIHSNNAEIINQLEILNVEPPNNSYENCMIEALTCHHNEIADYISKNYFQDQIKLINEASISSYNYYYFPKQDYDMFFHYFCQFDYFFIVNLLLKKRNVIEIKH